MMTSSGEMCLLELEISSFRECFSMLKIIDALHSGSRLLVVMKMKMLTMQTTCSCANPLPNA
jgi:hypothetical protein